MSDSRTILFLERDAERFREQLRNLSANNLVHPLFVVDHAGNAESLADGEFLAVDLDRELAALRLRLVRVVALRTGRGPGSAQVKREQLTVERLRQRGEPVGISFKTFTVSVVPTGAELADDWFQPFWTANLVVTPEESAGGEGFIAIDLNPDKVEAVSLAAASLVGGFWTWLDQGAFDNEANANVMAMSFVRLIRVSLRIVDAGDLTSRLIGWAMDPGGVWPIPNEFIGHGNPQPMVAELAQALAVAPEVGFTFTPYQPPAAPRPRSMGLFAAVALFYQRLWSYIVRMPIDYLERLGNSVADRVERIVQTQTFGDDSSVIVRITRRPETVSELVDGRTRTGLVTDLKAVGASAALPTPEAWRVVRSVVFGLADGGDFHGSMRGREPEWLGQRSVMDDRTLLAPRPGIDGEGTAFRIRAIELSAMGLLAQKETFVRSFDVASARVLSRLLDDSEVTASGSRDDGWLPNNWEDLVEADMYDEAVGAADIMATLASWGMPLPGDDDDLADDQGESVYGDRFEGQEEDPDGEEVEDFVPEPEPPVLPAPDRLFVLRQFRERFRQWQEARVGSLFWTLGESIDDSIKTAAADFELAEKLVDQVTRETEESEQLVSKVNRRIKRRVIFAIGLVLLLMLGAVASFVFVTVAIGYLLVAGIVSTVLVLPLTMYRSARQLTRLEFRLKRLNDLPDIILARRRHAASEMVRLARLNDQLNDWAEIVTSMLHRPWGRRAIEDGDSAWSATSATHVFSVGVPDVDPVKMDNEILRLRRFLARRGWMSALYLEHLEHWEERYARLLGTAPGPGTDPSNDVTPGDRIVMTMPQSGEAVYRARRQFRMDVLGDRFAEDLRATRVDTLRHNFDETHSPALLGRVSCAVAGLDRLMPNDFLAPVIRQTPIPGFARYFRHRVGGPNTEPEVAVYGMSSASATTPPDDGQERREIAVRGVAHRYLLASFRLDVSQSLSLDDVNFIEPPRHRSQDTTGAVAGDDSRIVG